MTLAVVDAGGTTRQLSTTTNPNDSNALVQSQALTDPATGQKAQVAAFHNADNQNPGGTAYGLLTGGVAQLLNVAANLDRQRETGQDGVPAAGISSGAASFAMAFKTSIALAITANASAQAVTPGAMSGTIGGVAWSIQVGSVLVVDTGANKEAIVVTAVTATTFSAIFSKNHGTTTPVVGFVYNQERDAAGEADGATGVGTAVAAEYEYNAGSPGGGNFDRARSVQAKGRTTTTVSSGGTQGSTSIVVGAAGTLKAGMQILLYDGSFPAAGHFESVYVDFSYSEGSTTVPLASAIANNATYTNVAYDSFAAFGPGLSGFNATGVGIEEEALWDPVSGLFYIERAATQDGMAAANIVAESPALFNGSTMDRQRTPLVFKPLNAVAIGSETTIWTPAGGKKFRIMGGLVSVGTAAGNVVLKDNTAGTTILVLPKAPLDTPFPLPPMGNGILSAAANNVLTATGVATATLSGFVFGTEE